MMSGDEWLVDGESGIRYKLPDDANKDVWYINYVKNSTYLNGVYTPTYGSMGPMLYETASRLFDKLDETSITLVNISKNKLN